MEQEWTLGLSESLIANKSSKIRSEVLYFYSDQKICSRGLFGNMYKIHYSCSADVVGSSLCRGCLVI